MDNAAGCSVSTTISVGMELFGTLERQIQHTHVPHVRVITIRPDMRHAAHELTSAQLKAHQPSCSSIHTYRLQPQSRTWELICTHDHRDQAPASWLGCQ